MSMRSIARSPSESLTERMARMALPVKAALPQLLKDKFAEWDESERLPAWVLFVALVPMRAIVNMYEPLPSSDRTRTFEDHIKWSSVVGTFRRYLAEIGASNLVTLGHVNRGAKVAVAGKRDAIEELREHALGAIKAVDPGRIIVDLIRSPQGYLPAKQGIDLAKLAVVHARLREDAAVVMRRWLDDKTDDWRSAWPDTLPREEAVDNPPPLLKRGRTGGNDEDDEDDAVVQNPPDFDRIFAQLRDSMLGAALVTQVQLLDDLGKLYECGAIKQFARSSYAEGLGIVGDQPLWEELCERRGWVTPPIVRLEEAEPSRMRMSKPPRLVLKVQRDSADVVWEPEFSRMPAVMRPVRDWYAHFMDRCEG